jgi:hypothetical protein
MAKLRSQILEKRDGVDERRRRGKQTQDPSRRKRIALRLSLRSKGFTGPYIFPFCILKLVFLRGTKQDGANQC